MLTLCFKNPKFNFLASGRVTIFLLLIGGSGRVELNESDMWSQKVQPWTSLGQNKVTQI